MFNKCRLQITFCSKFVVNFVLKWHDFYQTNGLALIQDQLSFTWKIHYMTSIWLIYSAKYTRNNNHHHHHHLAYGCCCWYFIYTRPVDFLQVINEFTSPPTLPRIKYCYNRNMPWNFTFNHKMTKIVCTAEIQALSRQIAQCRDVHTLSALIESC